MEHLDSTPKLLYYEHLRQTFGVSLDIHIHNFYTGYGVYIDSLAFSEPLIVFI